MRAPSRADPCGDLRLVGERSRLERWRPAIADAIARGRPQHLVLPAPDGDGFFKGSRLRGRAALRHAVRRWTRWSEIPRLREYQNLTWLREQGFLAPRPLLAGVYPARGLPRYQFLITEHLAGLPTWMEWLSSPRPSADRRTVLVALAHDLARLHALGFVHRDLFLRNLLLDPDARIRRPIFLDAWRGGPGRAWRGPDHDLACFFLDAAGCLSEEEQATWLREYALQRGSQGRPMAPDWLDRLARRRARVWKREVRRREDPLRPEWRPPMESGPRSP